jgi:hypothetical protein
MAIRSKLTERDPDASSPSSASGENGAARSARVEHSEEERATRKERVQKAKDALKRSAELKGEHVVSARQALKAYLQKLNDPRQPSDDQFEALIDAPFRQPPKRKERGFGGPGGFGGGRG